jgi:hypothetical protein
MLHPIPTSNESDYKNYLYGISDPKDKEFFEQRLQNYFLDLEGDLDNFIDDDRSIRVISESP